uniref:BHLH domain-containing protein n=1 Tax=Setaria digitata TaxID=48799 RepID=A0A915PUZ1_9BILA
MIVRSTQYNKLLTSLQTSLYLISQTSQLNSSAATTSARAAELDDDWMDFAPNSPLTNHVTNSSNHSEIEKRRRDRMNELMGQLAALLPATFCRKLDKLSLLRLALDHISTMSTSNDKELSCDCCAKHVTISDLLTLLKKNIEHFVTVVDISSGKILYASDEMNQFFGDNILTRNWYEILHPVDGIIFKKETATECHEDVNASDSVCETVSSSTGFYKQKTEWNLGLRRSFPCRLRVYNSEDSNHYEQNYEYFHCYGSLRHVDKPILVMLLIKIQTKTIQGVEEQFQMTVTPNGQVIRCGPGLPSVLKHLPQDLTGCYYYDLIHEGDLLDVAYHHKQGSGREISTASKSMLLGYHSRIHGTLKRNLSSLITEASGLFSDQINNFPLLQLFMQRYNSIRHDEESSPEESVLRQLLSNKRLQKNHQETAPELTVLGVARLGESATEEL